MSARDELSRICGPVAPPELTAAIDAFRAEVLIELAAKAETFRGDWGVVASWIRSEAQDPEWLREMAAASSPAPVNTNNDEAGRPNRFTASPAQVDDYLRRILCEDTLLNYQRAIGNRAVEEAAKDIRMETASLKAYGVLESDKDWAASAAADWIDPLKDGGHYPSVLLCGKHDGFGPCPGAPRCTPRDDEPKGGAR